MEGQAVKKNIYATRWRKKHICEDDKVFSNTLMEQNINAKLYRQVAHSPDVNLLELEFFRAIQSFNNTVPKNEEEWIQAVSMTYDSCPWKKIHQTWLTLQCCFNQILRHSGDNDYNVEHVSKEKLECTGQLPDVLDVVEDVEQILYTNTNTNDTNDEMEDEQTQTNA